MRKKASSLLIGQTKHNDEECNYIYQQVPSGDNVARSCTSTILLRVVSIFFSKEIAQWFLGYMNS